MTASGHSPRLRVRPHHKTTIEALVEWGMARPAALKLATALGYTRGVAEQSSSSDVELDDTLDVLEGLDEVLVIATEEGLSGLSPARTEERVQRTGAYLNAGLDVLAQALEDGDDIVALLLKVFEEGKAS